MFRNKRYDCLTKDLLKYLYLLKNVYYKVYLFVQRDEKSPLCINTLYFANFELLIAVHILPRIVSKIFVTSLSTTGNAVFSVQASATIKVYR